LLRTREKKLPERSTLNDVAHDSVSMKATEPRNAQATRPALASRSASNLSTASMMIVVLVLK
jgi:hypothetical protein